MNTKQLWNELCFLYLLLTATKTNSIEWIEMSYNKSQTQDLSQIFLFFWIWLSKQSISKEMVQKIMCSPFGQTSVRFTDQFVFINEKGVNRYQESKQMFRNSKKFNQIIN